MTENITQILITDNDSLELSDVLEYAVKSVKEYYPECEYTLYNNQMIIDFIKDHFDKEVLWAYNTLKPYAYKSDFARYCITYIKGGWYADVTTRMVSRLETYQNWDMICFYDAALIDFSSRFRFGIQNALFYTKPKNIILQKCIELIVKNCKNKFYGSFPVSPTGPGVLGLAYAKYGHTINSTLGMFQRLTPFYKYDNASYLLDDGWVIAQYKSAWYSQNIFDFGISEVNDYAEYWNAKNVYGEKDD